MKCEKCGGFVMNQTGGSSSLNCGWHPGELVRRFVAPNRGGVPLTKKEQLRQRSREDAMRGGR